MVWLDALTISQLRDLAVGDGGLDTLQLNYVALERLSLAELDALDLGGLCELDLPATFEAAARGEHRVYNTFAAAARGRYYILTSYAGAARGRHRVANHALISHRLYAGADASPTFAEAWETWTALGLEPLTLADDVDLLGQLSLDELEALRLDGLPYPHSARALLGASYLTIAELDALTLEGLDGLADGEATWHLVTRKRNAWGLESQNRGNPIAEGLITIDDDGAEVAVNPSAPREIAVAAAAAGAVLITASYLYPPDGDDAGTAWAIYLTTNGDDPDPDNDEAVSETMLKADGVAKLAYTAGPYAPATEVKAIVRTSRSGVESTNTTVYTATATATGPAAPAPVAWLGGVAIG